jgi:hypothetical protein
MARTIDIDLNSVVAKDIPDFGRITPVVNDQRNVRRIDTGDVIKRPGHEEKWDTGVDEPIKFLIPENTGYALDRFGNIFQLGDTINKIYTVAPIKVRPTYIKYNKKIVLATGTPVLEIDGGNVALVGNSLPSAKFVVLINDHAIYLGYHPTEFTSSVPGNPKSVDTAFGARRYNIQKSGTILNAIDFNEKLLIFKEKEIEVWDYRAGDPPFVRQPGAKVDVGIGAVDSLVRADEKIWFYGDDGSFYRLENFVPIKISPNQRTYIDNVADRTKWDGYDITTENVIMWNNRASGKTMLFDYRKDDWLEDNWWNKGCWEYMPFSAYMELGAKRYYGSSKYDGLIHETSYDIKTDNGEPIRVVKEFTVPLTQRGFNAKVSRLRFRRLSGQGSSTVSDPVFMVRTNFDKEGWSDYEHLTLGQVGDKAPYVDLDPVGVGKEMAVEIVHTDPTDFLITNVYATVEAGRH